MTSTTSLPVDDREGWIWFNGGMVPWREAKVHVLTHGLHYASCVFEGERVYGGRIFKLREHTERLFQSARILGFEIPFSVEEIEGASRDAVAAQKIENGYVRPGQVVVGTDSHTTSHGALGALAFGIGATEMASVWVLGHAVNVEVPATICGGPVPAAVMP